MIKKCNEIREIDKQIELEKLPWSIFKKMFYIDLRKGKKVYHDL